MLNHRLIAVGALMILLATIYNMVKKSRERKAVAAKLAHLQRRSTNSF